MVNGIEAVSRELAEYRTLCAILCELHEKFTKRRQILRELLEETIARKKEALVVLVKANRLTLRLTGGQRQVTGIQYQLGEIKTRINQINQNSLVLFTRELDEVETLPPNFGAETRFDFQAENPDSSRIRKELKGKSLLILGMIDRVKKQLLQIDILELRCKELIASIKKALKAFHHEFGTIKRKIYPFGIFSFLKRIIGCLFGRNYFSSRDLKEISALGRITGYVLKIADSAVL